MAIEAGQATHDAQVIGKVAVTVQLDKIGEQLVHIIQGVGALGVACDLGDLPRVQIAVNVFGELLAFFTELIDFS